MLKMYLFKKIQYVLCKSWNKYSRTKYFVRPCEGRIFLGANFPWANFPRANFPGANFPRANFPVSVMGGSGVVLGLFWAFE